MPPLTPPFSPLSLSGLHLSGLQTLCTTLPDVDHQAQQAITLRETTLTKPAGSLGRLEELTLWLGGWQRRQRPQLNHVSVLVFAGNHGVTAQGVSPWSSDVTAQMVHHFQQGGGAINQIAHVVGAKLNVICLEDLRPTADFTLAPALTEELFLKAVITGFHAVPPESDLICLGEMGIGNTTAAAAMAAALTGQTGKDWVGYGSGLNHEKIAHKAAIIDKALHRHTSYFNTPLAPLEIARCLGGYELAAILGATLAARYKNIPVILDGFVTLCAAAPLAFLNPHGYGLAHTCLSHCATPHGRTQSLATHIGLDPLLGLGLRLGEASGAALAVSLLKAAIACHNHMASFTEAGLSHSTTPTL